VLVFGKGLDDYTHCYVLMDVFWGFGYKNPKDKID